MADGRRRRAPLDAIALGTGPLEKVEVLRNGEVAHTAKPDKEPAELRFHWEDPAPKEGTSYYYVRVTQKDGEMAWSSPIWVQNGE